MHTLQETILWIIGFDLIHTRFKPPAVAEARFTAFGRRPSIHHRKVTSNLSHWTIWLDNPLALDFNKSDKQKMGENE